MRVSELWQEAKVPTHREMGEHVNSTLKGFRLDLNQGPSCCANRSTTTSPYVNILLS